MSQLPEIGDLVMLYPAPLPGAEAKPGKPLPLRRVQDGAGNYRRFLPDEGAERPFDYYWADRLARGDVVLSDPRAAYSRAATSPAKTDPSEPVS